MGRNNKVVKILDFLRSTEKLLFEPIAGPGEVGAENDRDVGNAHRHWPPVDHRVPAIEYPQCMNNRDNEKQ